MRRWVGLALCVAAFGCGGAREDPAGRAAPPGTTQPPTPTAVAVFDGTTGEGTAPDLERFDASGSSASSSGATLVAYDWAFGDGATASGEKVSHTFGPGTFAVTLVVTDSAGHEARAALSVTVRAPPSGTTRWIYSGASIVGTNHLDRIAIAEGSMLGALDPATGRPLWTVPSASPYDVPFPDATHFDPPLFVAPGSGNFLGYEIASVCCQVDRLIYEYSGADGASLRRVAGVETSSGRMTEPAMSATGDLAWSSSAPAYQSLSVRRSDGTRWLRDWGEYVPGEPFLEISAVGVLPGGDAVLDAIDFDPQGLALGGDHLRRLRAEGQALWDVATPPCSQIATARDGTIATLAHASAGFTFGSEALGPGTYLLVRTGEGEPLWAQGLPEGTGRIAMRPKGGVAVFVNPTDCSGPVVFAFGAGGALDWRRDLPAAGCSLAGVAIATLPEDVLLSGTSASDLELGAHTLAKGGFVLDLRD